MTRPATHAQGEHTPGPWSASDCHVYAYTDETDEVICRLDGAAVDAAFFSDVPGRCEANARLIAAAPDLLAACKAISNVAADIVAAYADVIGTEDEPGWIYDLRESTQRARAAVRAAKEEA